MKIRKLVRILEELPEDEEICIVDRNDSVQQVIELYDVGWVSELGRYVIWGDS